MKRKYLNLTLLLTLALSCDLLLAQDSSPSTSNSDATSSEVESLEDSWEYSPSNWKNSKYNFDNSTYNYRNTPTFFINQKGNPERLNIIGLLGMVTGYAVPKADGGVNYFNNDGLRIGFSPDGGLHQFDIDGDQTKYDIRKGNDN